MQSERKDILIVAVIQSQDMDNAQRALESIGASIEELPSVGGFLGKRNNTLLIKVSTQENDLAVEALKQTCRQRIEYIAVPLESAPLPLPTPTPITIGGATVFGLDIEHYEEF
ncbi:MAG: cyclic-di-AMP receptor [Anaerolineaceae bacterium]|nr:cyclic-di-AMP receptor [Anaerolineaceae bacterium]